MPTGSFKDRGASVMLSLLRAQGVTSVLEDSSGNGGAAIAAYAAAGGMQVKILVPASTSPAKTVQSRASGASIELVPGQSVQLADRLSGREQLRPTVAEVVNLAFQEQARDAVAPALRIGGGDRWGRGRGGNERRGARVGRVRYRDAAVVADRALDGFEEALLNFGVGKAGELLVRRGRRRVVGHQL